MTRVVPAISPFPGPAKIDPDRSWEALPQWPVSWIEPPDAPEAPFAGAFRLVLELPAARKLRFALTADERYELLVDGRRIDRGPDRGTLAHWNYAVYELALEPGRHVVMCRLWYLGAAAPTAQISLRPGLLVAGFDDAHPLLSTGHAEWQWQANPGWQTGKRSMVGPEEHIDLRRQSAGWLTGEGGDWLPAKTSGEHHGNNGFEMYPLGKRLLHPSLLPAQKLESITPKVVATDDREFCSSWEESAAAAEDLDSRDIPATCTRRFLLDLGKYRCGRLKIAVRGGRDCRIRTCWTEALFFPIAQAQDVPASGEQIYADKDQRDRWQGGHLQGITDDIVLDGAESVLETFWWRSGRFVEIHVETAGEPVVLQSVTVETTGYPFEPGPIQLDDPRWQALSDICLNSLQVCAHETLMDCPHYEQLSYAGDTRLQLLCWLALCPGDTALMRHTLLHFWDSTFANPARWTSSSAPSRGVQLIPPFSIWWVLTIGDFVRHTGDTEFIRPMLPAARAILEHWFEDVDPATGLLRAPAGWNYTDWCFREGAGYAGMPMGGRPGEVSSVLNLTVLHGLEGIEEIETRSGETLLAQRWQQKRQELLQNLVRQTWDADAGAFANTPAGEGFSEHAQALALLCSDLPDPQRSALRQWFQSPAPDDPQVVKCQAFFAYYLFKACRQEGLDEYLEKRLEPWWEVVEKGFTTTPENFGTTRSDAHAWSAHPILIALEKLGRSTGSA